jgi:hypothetical protein
MRFLVAPRLDTGRTTTVQYLPRVVFKTRDVNVDLGWLLDQPNFQPCLKTCRLLANFQEGKNFSVWVRSDSAFRAYAVGQRMVLSYYRRRAVAQPVNEATRAVLVRMYKAFAHEATHLALHGSKSVPRHRQEYEACKASALFVDEPLDQTDRRYIADKIAYGLKRGLKAVDRMSFIHSKRYLTERPASLTNVRSDDWNDWATCMRNYFCEPTTAG